MVVILGGIVMPYKVCRFCGSEIEDSRVLCPFCGEISEWADI